MKNVVMIVVDQMRKDALGYLGHPFVKTPNLDSLMSDNSIIFDHAYTASPSCVPSRASLLTGMSPSQNGRVGYIDGVPWDYTDTIAEVFRDHGYQTAAIGKMHSYPIRKNFGFEILKLHDGYMDFQRNPNIPYYEHQRVADDYITMLMDKLGSGADVNHTGVDNNSWVVSPWAYDENLHPTNWVVDETLEFLKKRDRTRPFFLMPSFVRPHPPFDPPQKYLDMYPQDIDYDTYQEDNWSDASLTEKFGSSVDSMFGAKDKTLRNEAFRGYYATITHIDHQISRLITELRNDGSYEDTIILFVSDHGEMLFEHHLFRKALPYEGSAGVPFFMRMGRNIDNIGLKTSSETIALHDIMPTLLDFCELDIPKQVDGISFKNHILKDEPIERKYIHGEHSYGDYSNHFIVSNDFKYIWYSQTGIEQLFDMVNDQDELNNLSEAKDYNETLQTYRDYLIKELTGREEGYTDGKKLMIKQAPKVVLENPGYKKND